MRPKLLIFAASLLALSGGAHLAAASAPAPVSGAYEGSLMISYDAARDAVTGAFDDRTGGGQFTCDFMFKGRRTPDGTIAVTTYYPGYRAEAPLKGRLTAAPDKAVTLSLADDPDGCGNVQHFSDKTEPATFSLDKPYPWQNISMVRSPRAALYNDEAGRALRKAWLVRGDPVGVRRIAGGYALIDYTGGRKPLSAWMKLTDLYKNEP